MCMFAATNCSFDKKEHTQKVIEKEEKLLSSSKVNSEVNESEWRGWKKFEMNDFNGGKIPLRKKNIQIIPFICTNHEEKYDERGFEENRKIIQREKEFI